MSLALKQQHCFSDYCYHDGAFVSSDAGGILARWPDYGGGHWFCFYLLPTMINNLSSFRPYELSWIDGGCNIVIYAIAGAILGGWRKYA
jgi:hypothetical protein